MSKHPAFPTPEGDPPPPYDAVAGPSSVPPTITQSQHGASSPFYDDSAGMQQLSLDDEQQTRHPPLTPGYAYSSASSAPVSQRTKSQRSLSPPCVIPQLKGALNTYATPFVRAYAPELANHGISKADFTVFVDGLNEAFLGNPILQGTNLVGTVLSNFHGLASMQLANGIIQAVSGVGSAVVSIGRARMYMQAMNESLSNPAGLHVNVLSTEKMLRHVGFSGAEFPTVGSSSDGASSDSFSSLGNKQPAPQHSGPDATTLRRMRKLEGYCQPLDDVPPSVQPDNLLKRIGNAQAVRMAQKHEQKMTEKYEKAEARD